MRNTRMKLVSGSVLVMLAGCTEQTRSAKNYHATRMVGISKADAFRAGKATLREYDFRIDEEDLQKGHLRSVPSGETIAGGTGRLRDSALKYPNRIRRTAILEVVPHAQALELMCKVLMERLDTSDHQVFRREHGTNDVPSDTPIQEEAGLTGRQNEVWTLIRRDRTLERRMMAAWTERLTGQGQSP